MFLLPCIGGKLYGQKIGYVDTQQFILELPQTKAADKALKAYNQALFKQGDDLLLKLKEDYKALEAKIASGSYAQNDIAKEESILKAKQLELKSFEQSLPQLMEIKRKELYEPIFNQVNEAIQHVGKTYNYDFIFQASPEMLVAKGEHVAPLLKNHLK